MNGQNFKNFENARKKYYEIRKFLILTTTIKVEIEDGRKVP